MMTNDLLTGLDPQQMEAVTADPTPLLISAGAGSGKTRVLTHRVAHMLQTGVCAPSEMFVSAFTRAAADEMRERIQTLVYADGLNIGTMHSICFRFINARRRGNDQLPFDVCKEGERTRVLRDLCDRPSKNFPQALNFDRVDIGLISSIISGWKNSMIHHDDEEVLQTIDETSTIMPIGQAARVYPLYEAYLRFNNKVDFDDMLLKMYDLLVDSPSVCEIARQQWKAFFIDECQDTNAVQYAILRLIAPPEFKPNVTLVGDSRQALYAFRGARHTLMDSFQEDWRARRIDLTANYRSTSEIVERANALANPFELPPQVSSRNGGAPTVVAEFDDPVDQAIEIARFVSEVRGMGRPGGNVAVLIRTNAQSAFIEKAFVAARLPYWCRSGGFFDRMEIGDVLAYLRLANMKTDEKSLRRIINRPTRYLGEAFCDAVMQIARTNGGDIVKAIPRVTSTRGRALSKNQREKAMDLHNLLCAIGGNSDDPVSPRIAIHTVLNWTDYVEWLKKNSGSEIAIDDSRLDNIGVLQEIAADYHSVTDLLEFVQVATDLQEENSADSTEITTVHRAKGREWPFVVASNFYEGSIPHKLSINEGNVDDERRVAYVAFTRAQDALLVTFPVRNEKGEQVGPSRFLASANLAANPNPTDEEILDNWWGDTLRNLDKETV
jgi:DNA helicase II / ATP-dependent DNA helicase PcrA